MDKIDLLFGYQYYRHSFFVFCFFILKAAISGKINTLAVYTRKLKWLWNLKQPCEAIYFINFIYIALEIPKYSSINIVFLQKLTYHEFNVIEQANRDLKMNLQNWIVSVNNEILQTLQWGPHSELTNRDLW